MVDLLEILRPNGSATELTLLSNICVYVGWSLMFLGFLGTIIITLDEKSFFYEGIQLLFLGLFLIVHLGTHSTVSLSSFFYYNSILIIIKPI